jgi:hypothetical protein
MKKIFSIILLAFVFAFAINLVYADEVNLQTDQNIYVNSLSDLDNYSQTEFSLKIRFTQLLGSIDNKIYQLNETINFLTEYNLDTNTVENKLTELEQIKLDVLDVLDSNNFSKDDLILNYVSLKQDSQRIVFETRDLIIDVIPLELYPEFKDRLVTSNKQLKTESQERIKSLVKEHNSKMKQNMNKGFNEFRNGFCDNNADCFKDKELLKYNFKNKLLEGKTKLNIEHQMLVNKNFDKLQNMMMNRHNKFNNGQGQGFGGNR